MIMGHHSRTACTTRLRDTTLNKLEKSNWAKTLTPPLGAIQLAVGVRGGGEACVYAFNRVVAIHHSGFSNGLGPVGLHERVEPRVTKTRGAGSSWQWPMILPYVLGCWGWGVLFWLEAMSSRRQVECTMGTPWGNSYSLRVSIKSLNARFLGV
jgi:hypothetical protein